MNNYVNHERKLEIEQRAEYLSGVISDEGQLIHAITFLCINYVKSQGICYQSFNAIIGVMAQVSIDFYKSVIKPFQIIAERDEKTL